MHASRKEEECYFQVRIERFFSFYFFFILRIEKKEKNPCNNKSWKQVFKVKNYHCLSVDYHHMRNFKNKKNQLYLQVLVRQTQKLCTKT